MNNTETDQLYLMIQALGCPGQEVRDNLEWGIKQIEEELAKKQAKMDLLFSKIDAAIEKWEGKGERDPIITVSSDLAELHPPTTRCVLPSGEVVDFTCFYQEDKSLPSDTVIVK